MEAERPVRQITDSRVLAAMAHPLRQRLIDILKVDGPATASVLAEHTGEAVANISHHLKVLGASELIAEAPELARDRRERWWRLVESRVRWSSEDFQDDPAAALVASAAESLNLEHHMNLARAWLAQDEATRVAWSSAFVSDRWMHLSEDELTALHDQLMAVFDHWSNREVPDDGAERQSVFVFAVGVPGRP